MIPRLLHTYISFIIGLVPLVFLLCALLGGGLGMLLALSDNWDTGHVRPGFTLTSWPGSSGFPRATAGSTQGEEDRLAAAAMPVVSQRAWDSQPPTKKLFPLLTMPLHFQEGMGWADFPHTAEGGVQALAAIDQAALNGGQKTTAHEVYDTLAMPGAVAFKDWAPVRAIDDAVTPGTFSPSRWTASWTPTHGMIKGVLNSGDFVVACVLGEWEIRDKDFADVGFGDCQRMTWTSQGWRIGAGAQPFPPPQTFPGSPLCRSMGWKELHYV